MMHRRTTGHTFRPCKNTANPSGRASYEFALGDRVCLTRTWTLHPMDGGPRVLGSYLENTVVVNSEWRRRTSAGVVGKSPGIASPSLSSLL